MFALGLAALLVYQPRWLLDYLSAEAGPLYYVDTRLPLIALTLDDGPDPETTDEILSVLAEHGARATFFLISDRVEGNESLVSRIVEAGHELGNHMTSDEPSVHLSPAEFEFALLEADSSLSRFATLRWTRPGSGWYDATMVSIARAHGYRVALASIYPYDGTIAWPAFSTWHMLVNARPGAVIALHDGGDRGRRTVAVLREALPALQARGYRAVTLSELQSTEK